MTKLTLTHDAYIVGNDDTVLNLINADGAEMAECIFGPYYTAFAKDEGGNEYDVFWRICDDFDPNTDEDESDACNWDEPIMIIDEDGKNLIAAGIECEIV